MKWISFIVVLGSLVAMQQASAQTIARQSQAMRAARAPAASDAGVRSTQDMVTLRNFDPETERTMWVLRDNGGFVFGTNSFGDIAKAVSFALPEGVSEAQVIGVNVWFGFKSSALTTETYSVQLFEGTASSGPGEAPLYSESFDLADVEANNDGTLDEGPTIHALAQPISVGATFFVSIDFGDYQPVDVGNVGIISSDTLGIRVTEVWELWREPRSWHNMSDAWFSNQNGDNGWHPWIEVRVETGVGTAVGATDELPEAVTLYSNYPNPFNPSTTLRFALPAPAEVRLEVIDLLGRTVATLLAGPMEAGRHVASFEAGSDLPSGVYLARLQAGSVTQTRTMVLLR